MILQVESLGNDEWSRQTLRNVKSGRIYVDINLGEGTPDWHSTTDWGEPLGRLRKDIVFEVVERQEEI